IHSLKTGVWLERLQNTEFNINWGQAIFPSLQTFLQGKPSQLSIQLNQGVLPWRSWLGAWFVQDSIKLRPNLTLSLGLRHEFSNGYHNKFQNASNLVPGPGGVLLTEPVIGDSLLAKNTEKWLFGPRAGLGWDPAGCTARNHRPLSIRSRTAFRRRDIAPSHLQWIARLPRHLTCGCQHGDSNHLLASGCELSRRLDGWHEIFSCGCVETKPA